jgi:hypothetical protein
MWSLAGVSLTAAPMAVCWPYRTWCQVTDLELDKGLLHVMNRGLLPPKADLTPALCGTTGAAGRVVVQRKRNGAGLGLCGVGHSPEGF